MSYRRATRSSHYSDDSSSYSETSSNQLSDDASVQSNAKKKGNQSLKRTTRRRQHNAGRYPINEIEEQDLVAITGPKLRPETDRAHRAFWAQLDLDDDDDDDETTNSLMTNSTYNIAKAKNLPNRGDNIFDRMAGICSGGCVLKSEGK